LVVSTCYVASEYHTSFIFDRVLYSAAVLLCCCGSAILLLARFLSADPASTGSADHKAIPLEERRASQSQSRGTSLDDSRDGPRPYSLAQGRKLRLLFLLLVSLICVRVVILFYVLRDVQCAGQGYQVGTCRPPPTLARRMELTQKVFVTICPGFVRTCAKETLSERPRRRRCRC
jgi:hypothetical protein